MHKNVTKETWEFDNEPLNSEKRIENQKKKGLSKIVYMESNRERLFSYSIIKDHSVIIEPNRHTIQVNRINNLGKQYIHKVQDHPATRDNLKETPNLKHLWMQMNQTILQI